MTVFDLRVVVSRLESGLKTSLEAAVSRAVSRGNGQVEVEHWLAELLDAGSAANRPMAALDVPRARAADEVATALDRLRGGHTGAPALSRTLLEWVEEAWLNASLRFGRDAVAPEDLLLALTTSSTLSRVARGIAPSLRLDEGRALALAEAVTPEARRVARPDAGAPAAGPPGADAQELGRYTLDLTAEARAGRLDPVVGREAELRQVIDILLRRRQNNPILAGEAGRRQDGGGRGLALRIAAGTVPARLLKTSSCGARSRRCCRPAPA